MNVRTVTRVARISGSFESDVLYPRLELTEIAEILEMKTCELCRHSFFRPVGVSAKSNPVKLCKSCVIKENHVAEGPSAEVIRVLHKANPELSRSNRRWDAELARAQLRGMVDEVALVDEEDSLFSLSVRLGVPIHDAGDDTALARSARTREAGSKAKARPVARKRLPGLAGKVARTCGAKIQHTTKEAVLLAAAALNARQHKRERNIEAYRCPFCPYWHCGHEIKSRETPTR